MNLTENIIILALFLVLLIIIAHILLDRRNKLPKPNSQIQDQDSMYDKIRQLKNELRQDTKDRSIKNPVLDILVKHKKAEKTVSKFKPQFSVDKPLKLEELQEELDITKKDITEEIDDVQETKLNDVKIDKPKPQERKIEDLIGKNIASDDTIINQNHYFRLESGKYIKTIPELIDAIDQMPHIEFEKYVSAKNNDFANWIEHVFNNKSLAHELRKDISKRHALIILRGFVHK